MDAQGRFTTAAYDLAGNLASSTDPAGFRTTSAYDALNRVTSVKIPDGARRPQPTTPPTT